MTRTIPFIVCGCALLFSCEKRSKAELTVADLLKAQNMVAFMVELPEDVEKTDFVRLELFGEKGLVDSADFAHGLKPGEILRIFIHDNRGEYRFSVVSDTVTVNDIELKLGDAKLRAWLGNSNDHVFEVGDSLAGFTIDDHVSYTSPSGDDLGLRVAIKKSGEPQR